MRAICIKSFVNDGVLVNIGDSVDFTEARLTALASLGFVKAETVKAEEKAEPKKAKKTKRGE